MSADVEKWLKEGGPIGVSVVRAALADMTRQRDEAVKAFQRERARVGRVEKLVWAASFYGARVIDLRDLRAALADRPQS